MQLALMCFSYYNFNSIKVRLKHLLKSCRFTRMLFQFHKGTIKTNNAGKFYIKDAISIP